MARAAGIRGHQWAFESDARRGTLGLDAGEESGAAQVVDELVQGVGAYGVGRKLFGAAAGPWDETWMGWWGDDPRYHRRVLVLPDTIRTVRALPRPSWVTVAS
jgi:hypothetical protein